MLGKNNFFKNSLLFILCLSLYSSQIPTQKPKQPERERGAGILLHITSLPSNYGVGTFGKEAYRFVDFLVKAKQKYWQMLPLGPTSYGDSPYQSTYSFAGNPYMIDLDMLIEEGLLEEAEVKEVFWGYDEARVDYGNLWDKKYKILRKAFERFIPDKDYDLFLKENKNWLDDYALFMAVREKFEFKSWTLWPKDIKLRQKTAMDRYKRQLTKNINFNYFIQYKFYQQLNLLKKYCKSKNIKLIGDVPIYVPLDSCDVWQSPDMFQLDANCTPIAVAGVPPDAFTADGQLWGNPLYDWKKMAKDDYKWFINRLRATGAIFDVIRIDHFRGLESYWSVPYGDKTAKNGKWVKGPDMGLINAIHKQLPEIDFIAEDLGYLTPEVLELRDNSGFPGMKILEFAFYSGQRSAYLPYKYIKNSVCYAGTHDNEVLKKWQDDLARDDRKFVEKYLGLAENDDLRMPIIRAGMASVSYLFVAQLQDYIGLGTEARMNRPGITDGNNWRWRALKEHINDRLAERIAELTVLYER